MTSKTKTTTKKAPATKESVATVAQTTTPLVPVDDQINSDFKNAVLVVSLTVNAFVLVAWVVLNVTSAYDYQVATFLFYR